MAFSRTGRGESVDVSDFSKFAKALRKAAPESSVRMRKGLRVAAEGIAEKTRMNAGFSKRIPGSVKIRTSGVKVTIVAGGKAAPNAAAIENRGKGHVRHPVFGDREVWTDKNSPPAFMGPAVVEGMPLFRAALTNVLRDAVDDIKRDMGS